MTDPKATPGSKSRPRPAPDAGGADAAPLDASQESLDKIRDILFGRESQDNRERFDQIGQDVAGVRNELARAIESLEQSTRNQLDALSQRLADLDRRTEQHLDELRADVGDLRASRVDRKRLAALFTELAAELSREDGSPE